jgi:hypothetical protein
MKITLTTNEVSDYLRRDTSAHWSYEAANALAEYLEELENGASEEMELEVVAIRCDFSEYSSALDAAIEYGYDEMDEEADDEDKEAEALEWMQDHTTVIEFDGGVVIQQF